MRLRLAPTTGAYELTDKRTGVTWSSNPRQPRLGTVVLGYGHYRRKFANLSRFIEKMETHGAAGWQMNVHAWRRTQRLGFDYCSDSRGTHPFLPVCRAQMDISFIPPHRPR